MIFNLSISVFPPLRILSRALILPLLLAAAFALAGCESSEERAERHFRSALALIEAGDEDRAMVEFRNVFKYDGFHKEARETYAAMLLRRGEVAQSYGQYLRLIEQYPDTAEVRRILAEIAISRSDWPEAERHGTAAIALTPDDPAVRGVAAGLAYRSAVLTRDAEARAKAAEAARALLAGHPDNRVARRVVIDWLMNAGDHAAALPEVDLALEAEPGALDLHLLRLRLLTGGENVIGRDPAVGEQLRAMYARFPDNDQIQTMLTGWYMAQGDLDGAEAFLRDLTGGAQDDPTHHVALIRFLQHQRSPAVALAELDRLIEAAGDHGNADLFRALRAATGFEAGARDASITELEAVLREAPPGDQTRQVKLTLARMYLATGNLVGARARVEEILAEDASHVEALKLRAAWAIEDDRPGAAIVDLRAALNQAPRDPQIMTLMAQAHERDGSRDLAGERLALAVEVSNHASAESLRYAAFLQREGRPAAAASVLGDAHRANPADVAVLVALAELHLSQRDPARAELAIELLAALPGPEASAATARLRTAHALSESTAEEGIALLQEMIDTGQSSTATVATMIQAQLRAGQPEAARESLDRLLAEHPGDGQLRLLDASLRASQGDAAGAESALTALLATDPGAEAPLRMLYGLLLAEGRAPEAAGLLQAGLEAQPGSLRLRAMRAGELERGGDIAGAIAVYDALYAEHNTNPVIANNLASLLTAHGDDPVALERGFAIARRLRGLEVPAFQDTYGWIEYRRGNLSEALAHLEPAAAGLPEDALVQYHLGMTYAALERHDEARATLRRALDLAGDRSLPQFEQARATLRTLEAGSGEEPSTVPAR